MNLIRVRRIRELLTTLKLKIEQEQAWFDMAPPYAYQTTKHSGRLLVLQDFTPPEIPEAFNQKYYKRLIHEGIFLIGDLFITTDFDKPIVQFLVTTSNNPTIDKGTTIGLDFDKYGIEWKLERRKT